MALSRTPLSSYALPRSTSTAVEFGSSWRDWVKSAIAIKILLTVITASAFQKCLGLVGVEANGIVKVFNCTVAIVLSLVRQATTVIRTRIVGIQLNRLGKVGDSVVMVAAIVIGDA